MVSPNLNSHVVEKVMQNANLVGATLGVAKLNCRPGPEDAGVWTRAAELLCRSPQPLFDLELLHPLCP